MTQEFSPVTCPVDGCDYEDLVRAVAAHVSRTDDADHEWDRLEYDGPKEFVQVEKTEQRAARRTDDADRRGDGDTASGRESVAPAESWTSSDRSADGRDEDRRDEDERTAGGRESTGQDPAGRTAAGAEPSGGGDGPLDRTFLEEAAAVDALLSRYGVDDLSELDPFRLANLYALLSMLAGDADEARTEVRDELLEQVQDDRTIETDVGDVSRQTDQRRRLRDEATVRERLEAAGVDPTDAMSFDRTRVDEAVRQAGIDPDEVFETEERAYVRRIDVDPAAVEELLASVDVDDEFEASR